MHTNLVPGTLMQQLPKRIYRNVSYTKDESHQIYRLNGMWHIAHSAVAVFYYAGGGASPPLTGWAASSGAKPPPTLKVTSGH